MQAIAKTSSALKVIGEYRLDGNMDSELKFRAQGHGFHIASQSLQDLVKRLGSALVVTYPNNDVDDLEMLPSVDASMVHGD